MSIFGSIWSKISGHHASAGQSPSTTPTASSQNPAQQQVATSPTSVANPEPTAAPQVAAPEPNSVGGSGQSPAPSPSSTPGGTSATGGGQAGGAQVDVAAVLTDLAAKKHEKLDWRHSIVDLLKVLDLDSSLTARKSLAEELHYTGDTGDSAAMNMWLSKQVMAKLTANGGKVPADLKD